MRLAFLFVAGVLTASAAQAMPVSTFLEKADKLKARGPLALVSSDFGLLKREIQGSAVYLRNERLAALKAGRKPAYCPPATQSKGMDVEEILGAMRAVPAAQRARTDVRDAMRGHMARKYPCPA